MAVTIAEAIYRLVGGLKYKCRVSPWPCSAVGHADGAAAGGAVAPGRRSMLWPLSPTPLGIKRETPKAGTNLSYGTNGYYLP